MKGCEAMAKHAWAQAAVRGLNPTCKISPTAVKKQSITTNFLPCQQSTAIYVCKTKKRKKTNQENA